MRKKILNPVKILYPCWPIRFVVAK